MEPARYVALIGDVVGSREVEDREALQRRLRRLMGEVNRRFAGAIAARFTLTAGDEFQGLLGRAGGIGEICGLLRARLDPVEIRLGLGVGGLSTALEAEAIGMDGPCFHRAREALNRAKERGSPVEAVTGGDEGVFEVYGSLYGALRRGWTLRQREAVDWTMAGLKGREVARRMGVGPSTVSLHLKAAEARAVLAATEVWVRALETALGEDER